MKNISTAQSVTIPNNSLTPFRIIFYYGDESINTYEIDVYKKSGKFWADDFPIRYYLGKNDGIWTTELDQKKVDACLTFLKKARSMTGNCINMSTAYEEYNIIQNDTIKIGGGCDWSGLSYFDLRGLLFRENETALEIKKTELLKQYRSQLQGVWYYDSLSTTLTRNQIFTLTRTKRNSQSCYWQLGKHGAFSNHNNRILKLTNSDKYNIVGEYDAFIDIDCNVTKHKDGSITIKNYYGATFQLISLTKEKLTLKYLWN